MSVASSRVQSLNFEAADTACLPEVAEFFVESFWLESTTFGGGDDAFQLSRGERSQLVRTVSEDLGARYGLEDEKRPQSLFWTRLILAREPDGGQIVGCAGVEAALFDSSSGYVLRSDQAERLVRAEIDAMDAEESEEVAAVYLESGVGALAASVLQQRKPVVQPWAQAYAPFALLANLAVASSYRRGGLGRELCRWCEDGSAELGMGDVLLQVEEANAPASKLYAALGYSPVHRSEDTMSLRLAPAKPSLMSAFLPLENEKLLKEEPAAVVSMSKRVVS